MLLFPIVIFVLGLLIGSFLNVAILRFNTGRSIATGRSSCMKCARTLHWYELIPVFSFLALKGRCRTCRSEISFQYPVIELATAILFLLFYIKIPLAQGFTVYSWVTYLGSLIVISLCVVLTVYDYRHKIIPDEIVYPLLVFALIGIIIKASFFPAFSPVKAVIDGVWVGLPFFLFFAFSKGRAMGFGDVKLALAIGWLLGLSQGFAAMIISFWVGAITGLFLIGLTRQFSLKSQIPFGPFLIVGALIAATWNITVTSIIPIFH